MLTPQVDHSRGKTNNATNASSKLADVSTLANDVKDATFAGLHGLSRYTSTHSRDSTQALLLSRTALFKEQLSP